MSLIMSQLTAHAPGLQTMKEVAGDITPDTVNRIARSMLSFIGAYNREPDMLQDADQNPGKYHHPGPTRCTSITACVPAFVQESGDAIEGGISSANREAMNAGGHLDGDAVDVSSVTQPGQVEAVDLSTPPPGAVRCAPQLACVAVARARAKAHACTLLSLSVSPVAREAPARSRHPCHNALPGRGLALSANTMDVYVSDKSSLFSSSGSGCRYAVNEIDIQRVLSEQHGTEIEPLPEVSVPERLIPEEKLDSLVTQYSPEFVPVLGRESEGPKPPAEPALGVVQRRLSNGVTLNYLLCDNEPGSASARLCASGGRAAEPQAGPGVGAMQVGIRACAPPSPVMSICTTPRPVACWWQVAVVRCCQRIALLQV